MRVSSRADYGVRALFELALRAGQGPVHSKEIAARQEIPEAYLHQVLGALSRAGLIRSTRGPLGGHELSTQPSEISVHAILTALDGVDQKTHPHPDGLGASDDSTGHSAEQADFIPPPAALRALRSLW